MKPARILLTALVALGLSACGGATLSGGGAPAAAPIPAAPAAERDMSGLPAIEPGAVSQEAPANTASDQAATLPSQRLVIRNANLSITVDSVREAEVAVRAKAAELGGYVVSSQTSGDEQYSFATVVFRVPAQRFDEALAGVQGLARRVHSRTVTGDDVTEEYVDLEARLRTLEATRDRLLELLERSQRVEDALSVNTALTDVQGQVELVKGRMQYLKQSASLSTITVELQPVPVTPIVDEDAWRPLEVARVALRELVGFGQGLLNLAIVLLVWTPVWLPLLLAGRWGLRWLGRAARKPISPAPPAPPTS
jgi:hypothetical protein